MRSLEIAYFFPRISETFVSDVVLGLRRKGVLTEVYSRFDPSKTRAREDTEIESQIHPELASTSIKIHYETDISSSPVFRRLVVASCYDVIHFHFGEMLCEVAGYVHSDAKLFATLHTKKHLESLIACARQQPENVLSKAILLPTSDYLSKLCAPLKKYVAGIVTHKLGTDTQFFRPVARKAANEKLTFLINGRFVEKKNHKDVLKALSEVLEKGVNAHLVMIGDGVLSGKIHSLVNRLELSNNVTFSGKVAKEEVRELYQCADVTLQPSITDDTGDEEGLPTTIMEYSAMGIPTIAYPSAGIPEIVKDGKTGLLVENVSQLSRAMIRLAKDEILRHQMGKNARLFVEEGYNQERSIEKLRAIYYG